MSKINIAKTLDAKNLSCPLPILKTKKAIAEIGIGEYLEILATDRGSESDFQAWTKSTGHELTDYSQDGGIYRYIIRKTK